MINQIETYIEQLSQAPSPESLRLIAEKFNKNPFPKNFRRPEIKNIVETLEHFCKDQLTTCGRQFSIIDHALDNDQQQVATSDRLLKKLQAQVEQEGQNTDTIAHADLQKSIAVFGKLIADALSIELSGTYQPGTVIDILLAFLWNKFSTPQEFDRYMASLLKTLDADSITMPLSSEMFTKNDYEKLRDLKDPQRILALTTDELVYVTLGYNLYDNKLPQHTKMLNSVKYQGLEFPDCGETSLRNLINALIYDPAHGTFNIDLLKKMDAIPSVINYYTRYQSPTALSLAEQESHDEWANVVSGLPDVKYGKNGICDIEPGIANMLCVIKNLFAGIASFEDLIKVLKEKLDVHVTLKSSQPLTCDFDNIVTLSVQKDWFTQFDLVWQFDKGHFELKYPDKKEISFATTYCDALEQRTHVSKPDAYCAAYLGLSPERLSNLPRLSYSPSLCVPVSTVR